MTDGGKACDVIHLEPPRVGHHRTDAGHPHQALRLGRGEHAITALVLDAPDLRREPRVLGELAFRRQPRHLWQGGGTRDVVLLEHRADRALALQPSTDEPQARAQ